MQHFHLSISKLAVLAFIVLLTSCENNDESISGVYSNGVFIVNEGGYTKTNASISFYSYDSDSVFSSIFEKVNGYVVGDVAQSIAIDGNTLYVIVNNSNKIEIVDKNTFSSKGVIEIDQPRYMAIKDGFGYVTSWNDHSVKVIDLTTNSVVKSYPVGQYPENLLIVHDKIFVTNAGGFDLETSTTINDSILSIIPIGGDEVYNLMLGTLNSSDIVLDMNNKIWVICKGYKNWVTGKESPARLIKINPSTDLIESSYELPEGLHPGVLEINASKDKIYFGGNYSFGIYEFSIEDPSKASTFLAVFPYGFKINSATNEMYVFYAAQDYISNGSFTRYTMEGSEIQTYGVGINPNGCAF